MKKTLVPILAIAFTAITLVGCAGHSRNEGGAMASDTPAESKAAGSSVGRGGGVVGHIPARSKFSKIAIGMPMKQVADLIGEPTDTKHYMTGKVWIPYYFGSDTSRIETFYKGEGRITFTGGSGMAGAMSGSPYKVYRIIYDPSESGYAR